MISLLVWLFFILVLLIVLHRLSKNKLFEKIPGPPGLFLLENTLDFLMDSERTFRYFTLLSNKYKRLFKLRVGPKKIVILYNPEDVEALISGMKYNDKGFLYGFIQPWLKGGLLLSNGEKWHQRRKILTPTFHFNILRNFNIILMENAAKLLLQIEEETNNPKSDTMDIVTDFTLKSICETAMGTKLDQEISEFGKKYKNAIHELGKIVVHRAQRVWIYPSLFFNLTQVGKSQEKFLKMISSFRDKVVKQRRESSNFEKDIHLVTTDGNNDEYVIYGKKRLAMLDLLLEAEKKGIINEAGINEEVDTFMFEGHDTTASALQFAFMILANHQHIQDKIVEEINQVLDPAVEIPTMNDLTHMKYLECCIKESLRMYPPVFFISRRSEHPIKLSNYDCPPGTEFTIFIRELHLNGDQFVEPLVYRPERFMEEPTWHQYGYIPFSAGPRNCIGQKFAMMEMKLALSTVLRRYRVLPVTKPQDISFITDFILRPKDPIYVKFEKRI